MIVLIIIGLLILVIMIFVFFNTSDSFRTETDCLRQGGSCVLNTQCRTDDGSTIGGGNGADLCSQSGFVCCRPHARLIGNTSN